MSPLFGKRKEEKIEETKSKPCNCDLCRFTNELYEKFDDPELRKIISKLIRVPSRIKNIDPEQTLKQAKKYENVGEMDLAFNNYNEALIAAISRRIDWTDYVEECIGFLGRAGARLKSPVDIKDYKEMLGRPSVVATVGQTYIKFFGYASEQKK